MDNLQFYILFNNISVLSGQKKGDNGRLCVTEPCLWLKRYQSLKDLNLVHSLADLEVHSLVDLGVTYWATWADH